MLKIYKLIILALLIFSATFAFPTVSSAQAQESEVTESSGQDLDELLRDTGDGVDLCLGSDCGSNPGCASGKCPSQQLIANMISWMKWIGLALGVTGFLMVAIMLMIGRRNRSQVAADSLTSLIWITVGLVILGMGAALSEAIISYSQENQVDEIVAVDFNSEN